MSEGKAKEKEAQVTEASAAGTVSPVGAASPASTAAPAPTSSTNKIIAFEPLSKTVQDILKTAQEKNLGEVIITKTVEETIEKTQQHLPCTLLLGIANNSEITSRYQVFTKLDSAMEQQGLKVFTVTPLKSQKLSFLFFKRFGVTEYIVEPLPARAIQFKAMQLMKAVDSFRREQQLLKAASTGTSLRPRVAIGKDLFLIKGAGMKKIGKNYVLDVDGPDSEQGEWVQHSNPGDAKTAWRWVPSAEKEAQANGSKPKDGWVLTGNKPTYNPETKKWALSSETPSLALHENGSPKGEKIGVDEKGNVFMAEDAPSPELSATEGKAPLGKELNASEGKEGEKPSLEALLEAPKPGSPRKLQLKKKNTEKSEEKNPELNDKRGADPEAKGVNDKRGDSVDAATPFNNHTGGKREEEKPPPADAAEGKIDPSQKKLVNVIKKDADPKGVNPLKPSGAAETEKPAKDFQDKKGPDSPILEARTSEPVATGKDYHGKEETPAGPTPAAAEGKAPAAAAESIAPPVSGARPLKLKNPPKEAAAEKEKSADSKAAPAAAKKEEEIVGKKEQAANLRSKMKVALDEISKRLAVPLADKMNPVEEDEIRGELGLRDRPEIKAKELSLKKRNADVKAMRAAHAKLKEELDGVEQQLAKPNSSHDSSAQKAAAANEVMNFKADAPIPSGNADNPKVFHSDTALTGEDSKAGKKDKDKAPRETAGKKDNFLYVPESGIQPLGNAWEKVEPYYIYVNGTIRYQGFKELTELLPLWIFNGDQLPELLDRTKQWRFNGGLPKQASTVEEVPPEVRAFLLGLRDQLKREKSAATQAPAQEKGKPATGGATSLASDKTVSGKAALIPAEKKQAGGAAPDLAAKKDGGDGITAAPSAEKKAETVSEAKSLEKTGGTASAQSKTFSPQDEQRNKDELPQAREAPGAAAKDKIAVQKTYVEKLEGKSELKSEAVKKFLENRKDKKPGSAPEAKAKPPAEPPKLRLVSPPEERSVSLGILVAIADAFTPGKSQKATMERILNAVESSFGDCYVAFTGKPEAEQKAKMLFRSRSAPSLESPVALGEGLCVAVERVNGATKNILGYLFLAKTGSRKGFDTVEETTVREVAERIWPLLAPENEGENKAA